MPEGDTVWLAARRMHAALADRTLTRSELRVPRLATVDLRGRAVREVASRGKHMLTRVQGGLTLHTHFEMDGSWHLYRPHARWRGGPAHQVRAVLANDEWVAVGYRLPVVDLLPTAEEARAVGHLGPDVLGSDWDIDEAVRRLRARPNREIGVALLDQRCVAGIGNLYKCETLFLCGVSPWLPTGGVDLPTLLDVARDLMLANREHPWQVTTQDPRRGRDHWVYDRAGRPCHRCGHRIASARQGDARYDRVTYWCAACQPHATA